MSPNGGVRLLDALPVPARALHTVPADCALVRTRSLVACESLPGNRRARGGWRASMVRCNEVSTSVKDGCVRIARRHARDAVGLNSVEVRVPTMTYQVAVGKGAHHCVV